MKIQTENLPNFLFVGAAKSGTTSLYKYITQHEQVFVPKGKELRFFSNMRGDYVGPGDERSCNQRIIRHIEDYKKRFKGHTEKCMGDMSTEYLFYHQESIKNIKEYLSDDVKIFIILRNPVDRAYSHYLHMVRDDREHLSFEEAIDQEKERKENNWAWHWGYTTNGFYFEQVKAYLHHFPNNTTVYIYDDLRANQEAMINDIFDKLDVNSIPINTGQVHNVSGIPKNRRLHRLINHPNRILGLLKRGARLVNREDLLMQRLQTISKKNLNKPKMREETRKQLIDMYETDIQNLEKLLDRNLDMWRQ
ncbi:hypothetical protein HNR44_002411 [Geomicrobium halophilum]|uniref:Sulfotransferase domain-containing protein n=1 Tax=Geomicrobium halophilum TaxID=549000 RepID=A0A841Q2C2_9BACL|nr:sulfotransferase [Geomicrobium halophilum]MBB6450428.1 hypothetical protein [Geomicrobium halophilum]